MRISVVYFRCETRNRALLQSINLLPVEFIGRKDEAENVIAADQAVSHREKFMDEISGRGWKRAGSQVQMERTVCRGELANEGRELGKGLTNTGEHIRVHVGIFAIKLTRKQRLCQRHRVPLDRYIFISISRMFLKLYRRGTSHMGHIFHNDVLPYTLENARPTWYRVNWNAPVCFARANRSPMRELYSEKKINKRYTRHTRDATEKEQELIIDWWSWKIAGMPILKAYLYYKCFYVCE